ncbi:pseudouridine synthase [Roseimaritima ulvae]|uniref:Pseudouridine synthase n=1 Tax=Roseimaritima ulvae TaxID=980254 RepID=A0A5B9QZN8_9BACT|nr:pseudouridine synthase [Roseimaritima ulvae]QEG43562.1 Ribosomal large subunit pseudouridine synthase B [Roseimaritima ulvae]
MAARKKPSPSPSGSADGKQRLQRVLAAAGLGSRRQCEEYITAGRVEVDGQIVDRLGATVDPKASKIFVDGTRLHLPKPVYFVLHKPVGVVTTNRDPMGRPRVIDLIPPEHRVFPVGRLDRNSEGLILMTNDGALADQLTHPRYGVLKVYHVTVAGQVTPEAMRKMREGIYIAEGRVSVDGAKIRKARSRATDMEISLREGKNREIRRILARLGHKVQHLRRVAIGPLRLGQLPSGAYRQLGYEEIKKLKAEAEAGELRARQAGGSRSKPAGTRSASPGKRTASKGTASKRVASKRGTGKGAASKRAAAKPSPRSSSAPKLEFDLSSSTPKTGAVIGGEPSKAKPAGKPKPKAKSGSRSKTKPKPNPRSTSKPSSTSKSKPKSKSFGKAAGKSAGRKPTSRKKKG